jgi:copper homeostasis protein
MAKLEIACFNLESAQRAVDASADAIELCDGASVGGTTPSLDTLTQLKEYILQNVGIRVQSPPVLVMVRPRGGNFNYSDSEFDQMKTSIRTYKDLADGFVFGILTTDLAIDVQRNAELVELAKPVPCTFHRAFDEIQNDNEPLEVIIKCGFRMVLTSGGKTSAYAGAHILSELVERAQGRIMVKPGGGVRSSHIKPLHEQVWADWYHSSALVGESGVRGVADTDEIVEMRRLLWDS